MSGFSDYGEGAILDALFNNVALQKANRYFQLHIGDPGENGTTNIAANNTRISITGAASAGGVFTSVNTLTFAVAPSTETYTHYSIWDALTVGNCLLTGQLTIAYAAGAGETVTLPAGSLTVTVT
jgi:hypothetical protein